MYPFGTNVGDTRVAFFKEDSTKLTNDDEISVTPAGGAFNVFDYQFSTFSVSTYIAKKCKPGIKETYITELVNCKYTISMCELCLTIYDKALVLILQVNTNGYLNFGGTSCESCISQASTNNFGYLIAINQPLAASEGTGAVFYRYNRMMLKFLF